MIRHVLSPGPFCLGRDLTERRQARNLGSDLRPRKAIFAPYALRLTPYARAYQMPRLALCRESTANVEQLQPGLVRLLESQA